jgi:DNA polymerase-1
MMTSTGRLGSGDDGFEPDKKRVSEAGNMQNIPDRLRRMYVADDEDSWLVQADWRQVEALVTAWLAGDEEMTSVILDGSRDIHAENALVLADAIGYHGLTIGDTDNVSFPNDPGKRSFRQAGKLTHKLHYGMGAEKFSRTYGIGRDVCARIIAAYFERWPKLAVWQRDTIEEASAQRQLETPFGRVLRFWAFDRKGRLQDREEALAFRPQSIVGDMIKVVGRRLYDYSQAAGGQYRLVTTTHDSWTLSHRGESPDAIALTVKKIMERRWPEMGACGRLPVLWCPVDVAVGKNWGKNSATRNEGGLRKWIGVQPAVERASLITGR